ncbi:MAG: tRNA uridine-5-carboxymethylaminomethyl(34) synthesis GTPase MnmE [Buchnera aphidicola (Chaetogeoica yunlongensis)]
MNIFNDTIVSRITPEGRSSVGIIRISGKLVYKVILIVLKKNKLPVRKACYLSFFDIFGKIIDQGISLWFPKPYSFTGEDVLELQGHGNPVIIDLIISTILSISGIRLANPGEFSERAFLNGKIDLVQAESVSDLINATSEQAVRASLRSLQGMFSVYINDLVKKFVNLRTKIETQINFSEEDINFNYEKNKIDYEINKIINNIKDIQNIAVKGNVIREGIRVVISGDPNSGKSSLLNALSFNDRAIVTHVPGTTRDVIYENIIINGILFILIDTAGLRSTKDFVEKIGIERAWKEIYSAEHILFVIDGSLSDFDQCKSYNTFINSVSNISHITIVFSKLDLNEFKSISSIKNSKYKILSVSSKTGLGIEELRQHLYVSTKKLNDTVDSSEGVILARRRHLNILFLILDKMIEGKKTWIEMCNFELLAEDLRLCQNYLGEITGKNTSDQLLSDIFSKFCIGK